MLNGELYDDDGTTWNEKEGKEPVSEPYHYAEWDYQIQLERPSWVTVLEKRAKAGELATHRRHHGTAQAHRLAA